jgi:hypothetical protein
VGGFFKSGALIEQNDAVGLDRRITPAQILSAHSVHVHRDLGRKFRSKFTLWKQGLKRKDVGCFQAKRMPIYGLKEPIYHKVTVMASTGNQLSSESGGASSRGLHDLREIARAILSNGGVGQ